MKLAMPPSYLGPPYLQNLSPAKMYVFLFLLQLKAASTRWTSGGRPRLVSGLGYPRSRVLAEYTQYSFPEGRGRRWVSGCGEMLQARLVLGHHFSGRRAYWVFLNREWPSAHILALYLEAGLTTRLFCFTSFLRQELI